MGKEFLKGYMYMYNWIILLYTWNCHNIVNQLLQNKRKPKKGITICQAAHQVH